MSGSRSSTARLRAHISTLFDFFRSFFVCLGLDIPSVSTVVHYDVARSVDTFVHRSGRTAVSQPRKNCSVWCMGGNRSTV